MIKEVILNIYLSYEYIKLHIKFEFSKHIESLVIIAFLS